jgi:selenide,water dikinase
VAALPPDLDVHIMTEILRGGAEKTREAGAVLAGGHTLQDKEPKFGLVVLGFVNPQWMITKSGACPGDRLVLTKPLGFGVTTTALKRQKAAADDVAEVSGWMKRLNQQASMLAYQFHVRSGTDVTGYSLLGHASEMAGASGVGLSLKYDKIPFVSCARKYAQAWTFPGGAADNKLFFGSKVHFGRGFDDADQMLLFDPQTSGGLLLAVPEMQIGAFIARAAELGQPVWEIGTVLTGQGIEVE